ncbi:MAG: MG2 domain-containing protein [candidate division Zixibacteria bacterium]
MKGIKRKILKRAVGWMIVCTCGILTVAVVASLADPTQDKPDHNVRVANFSPTELVTRPTNITVVFSRDLVPDDSVDILFADPPLGFQPSIPGLAKWIDNNTLRFYPDSMFLPATEYNVWVESDRTYLYGNRIDEDKIFHFRTPPLTVGDIRTEIINIPDPPFESRLLIHISFNYPVAVSDFLAGFSTSLKTDNRSVDFSSRQKIPAANFTLTSEPFDPKEVHGRFTLKIEQGLNCVNGNIPLAVDYTKEFTIPKPRPFVVNHVRSRGAGINCVVDISLSQSVAKSELNEYISITPAVDFSIDQQYYSIILRGNFRPRETYTIDIGRGLQSINGQPLDKEFSTKIHIEDLRPSVRFVDEGVYMSKSGRQLMAVETVNIDEITVEVEQVFANNIVYYLSGDRGGYYGPNIRSVGRRIFHKEFRLAKILNEPVNSTIDLGAIVGDSLRGIYTVAVNAKDRRWRQARRQVMITDLGILVRRSDDYLMVWVNSLSGTTPVPNAEVRLMSRNNQILADGITDTDGIAIFEDIDRNFKQAEPFMITVTRGNDLSYLRFSDCIISTSEFNVAGRPYLTRGYEAFIFSDRGVYRPGEKIHLISTVRGKDGIVPPEFPYIVEIKDPRGQDFTEFKLTSGNDGISAIDYEIPDFAQTGRYLILAGIGDNIIGRYDFQVEEFMPDRIKTVLSTDKNIYNTGDTAIIDISGKYLFGPPCAGNAVSGHITIEGDVFSPKNWQAFTFSNSDIEFSSMEINLPDTRLDDSGNHRYEYTIPRGLTPPSALTMILSATIQEDGGRSVSDYRAVTLNPYPVYLGLRQNFDGFIRPGNPASFSVIAVELSGDPVALDTAWVKLYRTIYQTIVKKDRHGNYRYVSEPQDHIVDSIFVAISDSLSNIDFRTTEYGSYKVVVASNSTAHTAAKSFYVSGWGYSPWSMANPDRIEMELDKESYLADDTARLLIKAPFNGRLLLTIEKDMVLDTKSYDLDSNTAEIVIPVSKQYAPNIYITATLLKSTTSLERHSPSRAFGMIPLKIDNSDLGIDINLKIPDVTRPRQKIEVKIESNTKQGAKFVVALVDVGILQLTGFETPDPFEYFYGKKRPSLIPYDIYSVIYPDIEAAGEILSPAGGAVLAERKRHLNPITARRVKPLALWSGLLETDTVGNAKVEFYLPQFNGKLKAMVVMIDGKRCGSVSNDIIVRDKIVIQESLPRFLSLGDKLEARFVTFNNTGTPDSINLALIVTDPAKNVSSQNKTVFIDNGKRTESVFRYTAPDLPGKLFFEISATNGIESSTETIELPNRPAQPLLTEHGSGTVEDGSPAVIVMPKKWIEGTAEYRLRLSSMPAVRFTRSIQYLLRYPHGCVEQTTSRLIPLLYFDDLARVVEPEIFGGKGHEYFIQEGIMKISAMQRPDGSFQYWPYWNRSHPWASIYASHALVEARKAGYRVVDNVYDKMIYFLQEVVRDVNLESGKGVLRIYAAYVLALADQLDNSIINNLKRLNIYELPIYSRFQLAGAIAMTTGADDALWLLPVEIHPEKYEPETGGYFDSDIRANAILIETLCDIAPDHPSLAILVKETADKLSVGRWYTTQSNAFALMAMGKYFRKQETPDYTGTVVIDGKKFARFSMTDTSLTIPPSGNKNIEISINGTGRCYYYWQASGVSVDRSAKEFDNRLKVRRQYLNAEGKPLRLDAMELGDQIVVKITAEAMDRSLENVVINDLLPACLEIENQRLVTSAKLSWIPRAGHEIEHNDIRDDRLLLFVRLNRGQKFEYYYSLRVTSSGEFIIPPVAAECMYDPTIASAASSGNMFVIGY